MADGPPRPHCLLPSPSPSLRRHRISCRAPRRHSAGVAVATASQRSAPLSSLRRRKMRHKRVTLACPPSPRYKTVNTGFKRGSLTQDTLSATAPVPGARGKAQGGCPVLRLRRPQGPLLPRATRAGCVPPSSRACCWSSSPSVSSL